MGKRTPTGVPAEPRLVTGEAGGRDQQPQKTSTITHTPGISIPLALHLFPLLTN